MAKKVSRKKAGRKATATRAKKPAASLRRLEASATALPFEVGRSYLFCGVTRYFVGRVREVVGAFVVLDDASWVADTGRFSEAVSKFTLNEVERVADGWIVNTGALNDAGPWNGELPRSTK